MKHPITVLFALLLAFTLLGAATGDDVRAPDQQARAVTLRMETKTGVCSLVVISPGVALTAAHCKPGAKEGVARVEQNGKWLPIRSWHIFPGTDLARVEVPGLNCPCAPLLQGKAQQDEAVIIVGYPYGIGQVLTRGDVQEPVIFENEALLLVTASAAGGNSGGGAFIVRGGRAYLLGITSRAAPEGHLVLVVDVSQ